jgi:hypothetical protein
MNFAFAQGQYPRQMIRGTTDTLPKGLEILAHRREAKGKHGWKPASGEIQLN